MHNKNHKSLLLLLCFAFCSTYSFGQDIWRAIEVSQTGMVPSETVSLVSEYSLVEADYGKLLTKLEKAPAEFARKRGKLIEIPMPNGEIQEFEAFYSPMMAEGLCAKYPTIRDYKLLATDGSNITGRAGTNFFGFHATIRTPEGQVYIDPFADDQVELYASYYTKNYTKPQENLPACGVSTIGETVLDDLDVDNIEIPAQTISTRTPEGDVSLRMYRCAIGTTGEFSQAKGGTIASVLSAINTSVTRVNEIFEAEVAIRMILIEDNDLLIHLNPSTDPYVNSDDGLSLLQQNGDVLNGIIGFSAYDIGHVYTNGCTGGLGGIASFAGVCGPQKGSATTCHFSSNVDFIAVSITAHEMGHQFGASHSFNNCDEDNESGSTAYEPGSGWTIMSYAGACGAAKNMAGGSFNYFHGINIEQMTEFSRDGFGNSCAEVMETENVHPVVDHKYTDGFSIPMETPFRLEGSATDENNDDLTYSWEEFDLGPLSLPGMPIGDAPQFVSEVPDETPWRYLPALDKVVNNESDFREVLPFFEKDMTWRLTVRDNSSPAGGADWKEVQFYATESAGPFLVEYPSNPQNFTAGTEETILWDVSNTDNDIVDCQFVDIVLSDDGGYNYPYTLKSYTPNDGSETITIPNAVGTQVRIMVKASENIFYDISNLNSTIEPPTEPGYSAVVVPGYQAVCLPASPVININTEQFLNFDTPISLEVIDGLPAGAVATFANNVVAPGESTALTIDAETVLLSGPFNLTIRGIAGEDTVMLNTIIDLTSSDYSDLALVYPAAGESSIEAIPTFEWVNDTDAESYIFQLSDDPSFENGEVNIIEDGITTNSYEIPISLLKNKIYFWKVTGVNRCGTGVTTALNTFSSEALSCQQFTESSVPVNLPSSGTPTTELETVIVTNGQISDVSIRKLRGTHQNFKQLSATLTSPAGTSMVLFSNRCAGATSFNVSFDDASPTDIFCPMIGGIAMQPEGDLSVFNGEDLFGKWILAISDNTAGQGGKVDEYILDICSNASLSAPELVKNNKLLLGPGQSELINSGRLRVEDADTDQDELTYTLVEIPQYGDIRISGVNLAIGDKFTQQDLTDNKFKYYHTSTSGEAENDAFIFVVDDGEGGWIDLTTFEIEVDLANGINVSSFDYDVNVYPNPTNGLVNLVFADKAIQAFDLEITDILGRKLINKAVNGNQLAQDMSTYSAGTYFFKVSLENSSKVFKVLVQK